MTPTKTNLTTLSRTADARWNRDRASAVRFAPFLRVSPGLQGLVLMCSIVLVTLSASPLLPAATNFQVLHAFGNTGDGAGLWSGVAVDGKGHIYGTTYGGGDNYGTVYRLTLQRDGRWTEKFLYKFQYADVNGQYPIGSPILDATGNLYGTISQGGSYHSGTVFELSHGPSGWIFNLLYTFCSQPDCADGAVPWAGVVFDKAGNLYGTANNVFELSPGPVGWTESVLHNFCMQPDCYDGWLPRQGLILDAKGNLFGATQSGGDQYGGVVYKLKHLPDGSWRYRVLHRFHGPPDDGEDPVSGMLIAMDGSGNLYGTTPLGGRSGCDATTCGVLFKLTHEPDGHWKETILHKFKSGPGGYWPSAGVVIDSAGNLYGVTGAGGDKYCDCGAVYKLAPNPDGSWTYTVLHRFTGIDGLIPNANLVMDDKGNLYGTAQYGGPYGGGVVFKIVP